MICAHELHFGQFLTNAAGMSVLADNIRYVFERSGKGQDEFAASLGVTQPTISRWVDEDNPAKPKAERVLMLARAAGVSPEEFMSVPHEQWGRRAIGVPSAEELTEIVLRAQMEVEPGLPPHEWPRAFASALHSRLARFADDAAKSLDGDDRPGEDFDGDGEPQPPTT